MNKRLTFFFDRAEGDGTGGQVYSLVGRHDNGEILHQVFARSPIDTEGLVTADGGIDHESLTARLQAAGGGLVVEVFGSPDGDRLQPTVAAAAGYATASQMLVLRSGGEPDWVPAAGQAVTLADGDFVLMPTTAQEQTQLIDLVAQLGRLPGDYRALLLNVLRRPGLEAAMQRLEQRLDELAPNQAQSHVPAQASAEPARVVVKSGWWPWLLGLLLLLNLAGVGVLLLRQEKPVAGPAVPEQTLECPPVRECSSEAGSESGQSDIAGTHVKAEGEGENLGQPDPSTLDLNPDTNRETTPGVKPVTDESTNGGDANVGQAPRPIDDAAADPAPGPSDATTTTAADAVSTRQQEHLQVLESEFFTDWFAAQLADEDALSRIRKGHLSSDPGNWRGRDTVSEQDKEKIFYAVAKLIAYRSDLKPRDKDGKQMKPGDEAKVWQGSKNRTPIKRAFNLALANRDGTKMDAGTLSAQDREWLAWMACEVFSEELRNGDRAAIVRVDRKNDPAEHDVDLGLRCKDVDLQQVEKALLAAVDALKAAPAND